MSQQIWEWVKWDGRLAVSDVLRWTQAIWPEKKRRGQRPLGERRVTAEVLEIDARGYIRLSVMADEIIKNEHGMPLKTLRRGEIIVRKKATIGRGSPERKKWDDEAHRSVEVSVHLS